MASRFTRRGPTWWLRAQSSTRSCTLGASPVRSRTRSTSRRLTTAPTAVSAAAVSAAAGIVSQGRHGGPTRSMTARPATAAPTTARIVVAAGLRWSRVGGHRRPRTAQASPVTRTATGSTTRRSDGDAEQRVHGAGGQAGAALVAGVGGAVVVHRRGHPGVDGADGARGVEVVGQRGADLLEHAGGVRALLGGHRPPPVLEPLGGGAQLGAGVLPVLAVVVGEH